MFDANDIVCVSKEVKRAVTSDLSRVLQENGGLPAPPSARQIRSHTEVDRARTRRRRWPRWKHLGRRGQSPESDAHAGSELDAPSDDEQRRQLVKKQRALRPDAPEGGSSPLDALLRAAEQTEQSRAPADVPAGGGADVGAAASGGETAPTDAGHAGARRQDSDDTFWWERVRALEK